MTERGMNRREFLQASGLASASLVVLAAARAAEAAPPAITLEECISLTPEEMAQRSTVVRDAWDYLTKTVASIKDDQIRSKIQAVLQNPVPTIMQRLREPGAKRAAWQGLVDRGYLKDTPVEAFLPPTENVDFSFLPASGSGYESHHAYPGGLVMHTAFNMKVAVGLWQSYWEIDHMMLDRDVVIAAQALHDQHKPWVFQWDSNRLSRTEQPLAGTGEHHVLSLAESIHRGLPLAVCVAQACAHNHPGTPKDEAEPLAWIQAAGVLLGIDPKANGLLAPAGDTLPLPRRIENFVTRLGDHDYIIAAPASAWMIPIMKEIAAERYALAGADLTGKPFNAFRNYVFSQTTIMGLYNIYATQGRGALADTVAALVARA